MTRPRVLHIGNVANNGYLNAKLLRRVGVEADALCDEWHMISQPEWEDAPIEWNGGDPEAPLMEAAAEAGWQRPSWVRSPRLWDPKNTHETTLRVRGSLALAAPGLTLDYARLRRRYESLRAVQGTALRLTDVLRAGAWLGRFGRLFGPPERLFGSYDLVQAYGIHPILLLLADTGKPFVTFEHGTMRELRSRTTGTGGAQPGLPGGGKVIITNPDVLPSGPEAGPGGRGVRAAPGRRDEVPAGPVRAARTARSRELGLRPHGSVRATTGTSRAPTACCGRCRLVRQDRPRAFLLLNDWGLEVERSRALIAELGIEQNVRWLAPLPKLKLIDAYRASDLVLDQFVLGTFGAVTAEAMACGCPVLTSFDPSIHRSCSRNCRRWSTSAHLSRSTVS